MTGVPVHREIGGRLVPVWIAVCAVVGGLLFFSQLLEMPARSALRGYDNTFNYLWLRSAMVDGDWDFRNDLDQCDTLVPEQRASALALPLTKTRRIPNKYGIGWAMTTLPFYVLADGGLAAARGAGLTTLSRDGFNPVYQAVIQCGHLSLTILGLFLAVTTLASWTGVRSAAAAGVILVWGASPLLYYQTANVSMSHGVVFFWITLLAWVLDRVRSGPANSRFWLVAGAALAMAVITRFQAVIFGVVPMWALVRFAPTGRGRLLSATYFLAGAAPILGAQMYAWHTVYGEWLVFSYGGEGEVFSWAHPEVVRVLFSSWHGLFYWHPYLLVAAGCMVAWAWQARGAPVAWTFVFALSVYVSAAWWCWWFASSFGNRSFDAAMLPLMGGVAWMLARGSERVKNVLWTLGIAAGAWNFYLVLLYRSGAISRHTPVTWLEMIQAASSLREAIRF